MERPSTDQLPRITPLATAVVNQIAAGEVIERPASVVKELLENSVDAGSTRIEIEVEQGGHDLIRVVDDGCGILPDDLPLAFASHATSKLRSADDLFSIGTFGFRGEALASIGGVAQVTLQSRPRGSERGAMIECRGSDLSGVKPWGGSPGTRIEVRQLFYNTPVRRKFLRAPATEIGHITGGGHLAGPCPTPGYQTARVAPGSAGQWPVGLRDPADRQLLRPHRAVLRPAVEKQLAAGGKRAAGPVQPSYGRPPATAAPAGCSTCSSTLDP
ncbi:MAG: DNA mismatch repair endonuclease MutL [Gemmataceae bacterium]